MSFREINETISTQSGATVEPFDGAHLAVLVKSHPFWCLIGDPKKLAGIDQSNQLEMLNSAVAFFVIDAGLFPPPPELCNAVNATVPLGPILFAFEDKDSRRRMKACLLGAGVSAQGSRA